MPAPPGNSLRVVIQQLDSIDRRTSFRIVAYGGSHFARHSDFTTREALLEALRAAVPEFLEAELSFNSLGSAGCRVIFARDMQLDASQLRALGLDRGLRR
ncbi:MAG: hypothetical protein WB524_03290 [Acidobacteriaceae bacterium]|jgi:hypothetical protein